MVKYGGGDSMAVEFKKITEHDMDLLIIEEFLCDRNFANLFLEKVGLSNDYEICDAYHSLANADGESDITVVLHYKDKKVGVLIEDKIDAPTMEEQSSRYVRRGERQKKEGMYDEFVVFLAAPESYMTEHRADRNAEYENKVTYEEILSYFEGQQSERATYKAEVVRFALAEKKSGYILDPDEQVSAFWRAFRKYYQEHFGGTLLKGDDKERGSKSLWPEFYTATKGVKIIYKSDRGIVDMEFSGYGDRVGELHSQIGSLLGDMKLIPTGKSASAGRKKDAWQVDFKQPFEENEKAIHDVLEAVEELYRLSVEIAKVL